MHFFCYTKKVEFAISRIAIGYNKILLPYTCKVNVHHFVRMFAYVCYQQDSGSLLSGCKTKPLSLYFCEGVLTLDNSAAILNLVTHN